MQPTADFPGRQRQWSLAAGRGQSRVGLRLGCWLVLLSLLAAAPGCGGCTRQEDEEAQAQQDKEKAKPKVKPKPDFDDVRVVVEPNQPSSAMHPIKPGHWTSTSQLFKANNFEFAGELQAAATDAHDVPLDLPGTPFRMTSVRPVALAKGVGKNVESTFYVPPGATKAMLLTRLQGRGGGREALVVQPAINFMPDYQYYFVVLAKEPDRYKDLEKLPTVTTRYGDGFITHYKVSRPPVGISVPLPAEPLCWTSIAYVLWDGIDPSSLSLDQQQSLLDWLHWGGRLIVSGPDSLDNLKTSFLKPYLPSIEPESVKIGDADLARLRKFWTDSDRPVDHDLTVVKPWSGVKFVPGPNITALEGSGGLVVERRVGRGSIVATAFRLTEPRLHTWKYYDGFVNAFLLRRPPRDFREENITWFDTESYASAPATDISPNISEESPATPIDTSQINVPIKSLNKPGVNGQNYLDPQFTCGLRYFSRDEGYTFRGQLPVSDVDNSFAEQRDDVLREDALPTTGPGVAGWNDSHGVAPAARASLRDAAGIDIPQASFVINVLGVYLLVLVPLNWLVFRALGRVEWAWVAAPVIAIICALSVIRLAQLDIGFARSQTEVAVLEVQGDYPRAHLTRYTALYSSLSTTYDLRYDDPSTVLQPFSLSDENIKLLQGQDRSLVTYSRDADVSLMGFAVSSNSTAMVHSEQMFDLGGSIATAKNAAGDAVVANHSTLALSNVGLIGRDLQGDLQMAWIGDLAVGTEKTYILKHLDSQAKFEFPQWNDAPLTSAEHRSDKLNLRHLLDLISNPARLKPGDVQLIGWLEEELPGSHIEPSASQTRHGGLLLAHLRYAPPAGPKTDLGAPVSTARPEADRLLDESPAEPPPTEP